MVRLRTSDPFLFPVIITMGSMTVNHSNHSTYIGYIPLKIGPQKKPDTSHHNDP